MTVGRGGFVEDLPILAGRAPPHLARFHLHLHLAGAVEQGAALLQHRQLDAICRSVHRAGDEERSVLAAEADVGDGGQRMGRLHHGGRKGVAVHGGEAGIGVAQDGGGVGLSLGGVGQEETKREDHGQQAEEGNECTAGSGNHGRERLLFTAKAQSKLQTGDDRRSQTRFNGKNGRIRGKNSRRMDPRITQILRISRRREETYRKGAKSAKRERKERIFSSLFFFLCFFASFAPLR